MANMNTNLLIDRREIARSTLRGTQSGSSVFSDALASAGPAFEGAATSLISGKGVVSAAISTGISTLAGGDSGGSGGFLGMNLTRNTGRVPPPPSRPTSPSLPANTPAGGGIENYENSMGDFAMQATKMQMVMEKVQQQSLYFNTMSNISKTRHEAQMNACRNLKS